MIFWVVLAAMLGAAVMAVLVPLSRRRTVAEQHDDAGFYREQLSELERDRERGLISAPEAEAARAEAGRRLIRASERTDRLADLTGESALRRRRTAAVLLMAVVPLVSVGVYVATGSPHLPGEPLAARLAAAAASSPASEGDALLTRVEARLADAPDDRRGWELVAPIYLRAGRFDAAARAYSNLIRLGADGAEELGGLSEALVGAGGGTVSAEARQVLERARARDPDAPRVLFYLALAAEQDGDSSTAKAGYAAILSRAAADASYRGIVQARLDALDGQAGMRKLEGEVPPEIAAMVDGLDQRLATTGGSDAEWTRLLRALTVLGRADDARDRLAKARVALAGNAEALGALDRTERDLGLVGSSGVAEDAPLARELGLRQAQQP